MGDRVTKKERRGLDRRKNYRVKNPANSLLKSAPLSIEGFSAAPYNPREISEDALNGLETSLRQFGDLSGIVYNHKTQNLICAHQRRKAIERIGVDRIVWQEEYSTPRGKEATGYLLAGNGDRFNCRIVNWAEDVEELANVTANNPEIQGEFTGNINNMLEKIRDNNRTLYHSLRLEPLHVNLSEMPSVGDILQSFNTEDESQHTDDTVDFEGEHRDKGIKIQPKSQQGDVYSIGNHNGYCGDCMQLMSNIPNSTITGICTDPPYWLSPDGKARTWDDIEEGRNRGGYLGKNWDSSVPGINWAKECLRVLVPGGHMVAFSSLRTVHRLAVSLEDAGFEIRSQLAWVQFQDFPKSKNFDGVWEGYGTSLKHLYEPAILCRKPLDGTLQQNLDRWKAGALNIDRCRMKPQDPAWLGPKGKIGDRMVGGISEAEDEESVARIDSTLHDGDRWPPNMYYTPKATRSERERYCLDLPQVTGAASCNRTPGSKGLKHGRAGANHTASKIRNFHPTVKPLSVMKYFTALIGCQPKNSDLLPVILDPFGGSGTTGIACELLGFRSILMEQDPLYFDIMKARVKECTESNR